MIGNDLVDLRQAKKDSNWQRKGYLNKIFSSTEQQSIIDATDSNEMVWVLWSMKEAAYKIHNKKTGIRNFAPTKLVCSMIFSTENVLGEVLIDETSYFTKTQINSEYIHTIAIDFESSFDQIETTIFDLPHPSNYKRLNPNCISHHGRYLALVYSQKDLSN